MAQAVDINEFMEAVQAEIATWTLDGGSAKVFPITWDAPGIGDVQTLLKENRFPACLINDLGGKLQKENGKIWARRMSLTAVVPNLGDNVGQKANREARRLADYAVRNLEFNTALGLSVSPDDDATGGVTIDGTLKLVFKTIYFDYKLQRD